MSFQYFLIQATAATPCMLDIKRKRDREGTVEYIVYVGMPAIHLGAAS